MEMIVLAVDPGARTGLALYGKVNSGGLPFLHKAMTLSWSHPGNEVKAQLRAWAELWHPDLVAVEIPRQRGAIFQHDRRLIGKTLGAALRMAKNVGECYAKATEIAAFAEGLGLKVVRKEPASGGTKKQNPLPVWRARFPEFRGKTSEHARDAALLAFRVYNAAMFMSRIEANGRTRP